MATTRGNRTGPRSRRAAPAASKQPQRSGSWHDQWKSNAPSGAATEPGDPSGPTSRAWNAVWKATSGLRLREGERPASPKVARTPPRRRARQQLDEGWIEDAPRAGAPDGVAPDGDAPSPRKLSGRGAGARRR